MGEGRRTPIYYPGSMPRSAPKSARKVLVAHRGASAYAPEHTLEAYLLAIEQGADFIEPDLQATKDGALICLHDLTLERTTDAADVFPERGRLERSADGVLSRWHASDFTLSEIRALDAGSWFGAGFRGARVPTLAEAIEVASGRAGIFPETKAPEVYGSLGLDMERLLLAELTRHGLVDSRRGARTPVVIQSFSAESLRILGELGSEHPRLLLVDELPRSAEGLARIVDFATGIGPSKRLLMEDTGFVARAHGAELEVFPWTFRSDAPEPFGSVEDEMSYFLYDLGVDGLFTNNPDLFPRSPGSS